MNITNSMLVAPYSMPPSTSYWTGLKLDKGAGFIQALSESEMYSVLSSAQMISPLTKGNTVNKGTIQGEAAILCIQVKTFNLSSPRNL